MLPGSTFVKSFLRTYAEELGLDPHLIVEEYRADHEEPDELELQPFATPPAAGAASRGATGPAPPPPGVALALIVVGVLAFLIVLGLSGEDDGDGGEQAATVPRDRRRTPPRPRAPEQPEPRAELVVLRIVPEGETYVCVDRGEGTEILLRGDHHRARDLPRASACA